MRGLKWFDRYLDMPGLGRTPQGVRGLKFRNVEDAAAAAVSHPARGAWIEINSFFSSVTGTSRRTPQGVRGLK